MMHEDNPDYKRASDANQLNNLVENEKNEKHPFKIENIDDDYTKKLKD